MNDIFKQIKRFENIDFIEGEEFGFILPANHTEIIPKIAPNTVENVFNEHLSTNNDKMHIKGRYKVTVKQYMTEPSNGTFDFQDKWNNGKPMPMCIMSGTVLEETRGMFKMELEGKAEPSSYCFCCGRPLSNPVSKLYGIGPECSTKVGILRIASEEEAKEKWNQLVEQIENIKWTGWVIKSAIKNWEEVQ